MTAPYQILLSEDRLYSKNLVKEHPFVHDIRRAIQNYRNQSIGHYETGIQLRTLSHVRHDSQLAPNFALEVQIYDEHRKFNCIFKQVDYDGKTKTVELSENHQIVPLKQWLTAHFPPNDDLLCLSTMRKWWNYNGKSFKWSGLSTEVKSNIIQACVTIPKAWMPGMGKYLDHRDKNGKEVLEKLADSTGLLTASREIRTIALRLCLVRSRAYPWGLAIHASHRKQLKSALNRLHKCPQGIEDGFLPTTVKDNLLMDQYRRAPKLNPQLSRFASFAHGIQYIRLEFDMYNCLQFFRVSGGGFKGHLKPNSLNFNVLEKLPSLKGVLFVIPGRPKGILYSSSPIEWRGACVRKFRRLILQSMAHLIPPFVGIRLENFVDEEEADQFNTWREEFTNSQILMKEDLHELYEECGGGIELELEDWVPSDFEPQCTFEVDDVDASFPPRCHCSTSCDWTFQ